jgi:arginine decarboxylase
MAQAQSDLSGTLLSAIASPAQWRIDAWNRLRLLDEKLLARKTPEGERQLAADLALLRKAERFWCFPGVEAVDRLTQLLQRGDLDIFHTEVKRICSLVGDEGDQAAVRPEAQAAFAHRLLQVKGGPKYFTVLLVGDLDPASVRELRDDLRRAQEQQSDFVYDVLLETSFEDALFAVLFNPDIQACVIRESFPLRSSDPLPTLKGLVEGDLERAAKEESPGIALGKAIAEKRPELDLYFISDSSVTVAPDVFDRTFYRYESPHELHMTLLQGVRDRYETPFFDALRHYAELPIGNMHALPIARGHSVFNSHWIRDMADFYGPNLFMAESSSTAGGLDSLLEPTGTIKEAQVKAARAFGAQRTFFVTNGTSTGNKIVHATLLAPGDIVLIDRNCHKSHHYGLLQAGAEPLYLDAYAVQAYATYGAVPLEVIKSKLHALERAGRLDRVKLIVLTNCTFDGMVYDPARVMEEVLAIKPDVAFLWDEAWFAFARCLPLARQRTAMAAAKRLSERFASAAYREEFRSSRARRGGKPGAERALPDPDKVRLRVYATQSTHKSLSALRQGSMIHVWDDEFERRASETFTEAFYTHTSTSPNHQIVASLDLARRQIELEGYGMVKNAYQLALRLREAVARDPLLSRFYEVLDQNQLVPAQFRPSGFESYVGDEGLRSIGAAWSSDEFVLDPTRLTLYCARTGSSGFEFRSQVLMKRLGLQVNHTSINTVLINATIGVTWSALSYLLDGLRRYAQELDRELSSATEAERKVFEKKIRRITDEIPPLPDFSSFHSAFRSPSSVGEGRMRAAYFSALGEDNLEYVPLPEAQRRLDAKRPLVSTRFVVPYPPGFPILVPGQEINQEILRFMRELDVKEVHGYRAQLGLSVFSEHALEAAERAAGISREVEHPEEATTLLQ